MNEAQRLRELEAQMLRLVNTVNAIRERTDAAIRTLQQHTLQLVGSVEGLQAAVRQLAILAGAPAEPEQSEDSTSCH